MKAYIPVRNGLAVLRTTSSSNLKLEIVGQW